tara:strand:+ start:133 stop:681 length:549 start_codon:yes stop_codon:yes gene_type:complete
MKILALDLATKTGWALLANGVTSCGVVNFGNGKKKADGKDPDAPQARFEDWIAKHIRLWKIDVVVYEEVYRWMSQRAANIYNGQRGYMRSKAYRCGIKRVSYSPPTIKKHFTGNGHAKKKDMIAEAERRWPSLEIIDDNQVDALAILSLYCDMTNNPNIIDPGLFNTDTYCWADTPQPTDPS